MVRLRRPRSIPHLIRQVLAASLAMAALVLAARPETATSAASGPPTVPVVVAAADLPAGAALAAGDLEIAWWPSALVPAGVAASPDEVTGRTLAGGLRSGEPVSDRRLVGPGLTASLGDGSVAAPVRLADLAVAELARPGDRVDVLATAPDAETAEVVVSGALVLAPASSDGEPLEPAATEGLLLLAVDPDTAARLAAAAASDTLSVTLAPP
jgi:pilus assembly protein CpaB